MPSNTDFVEKLSDAELYKELKERGFNPGPVVASTRDLYIRKLIQILDGERRDDNQPLVSHDDDMGEASSRPIMRHSFGGGVTSLTNSSRSEAINYPFGEASVTPKDRPFAEKGGRRSPVTRSKWTISPRALDDLAGPSWLTGDSSKLPPSWEEFESSQHDLQRTETFGKSQQSMFTQVNDDTPGYSIRHRTSLTGSSTSRFREPGFSSETLLRRVQDRQQRRSFSTWIWICLFTVITLASIGLLYMVYNAWFENDPYQQIEDDVKKFMEEQETMKDPKP